MLRQSTRKIFVGTNSLRVVELVKVELQQCRQHRRGFHGYDTAINPVLEMTTRKNPMPSTSSNTTASSNIDFSGMTEYGLLSAALQLHEEYDDHLAGTFSNIKDISADDDDKNNNNSVTRVQALKTFLTCLEQDAVPVMICHRIASLMTDMTNALKDSNTVVITSTTTHLPHHHHYDWQQVTTHISGLLDYYNAHNHTKKYHELLYSYNQEWIRCSTILSALQSLQSNDWASNDIIDKDNFIHGENDNNDRHATMMVSKRAQWYIEIYKNRGVALVYHRELWDTLTHTEQQFLSMLLHVHIQRQHEKQNNVFRSHHEINNNNDSNTSVEQYLEAILIMKQKKANLLGYDCHLDQILSFHNKFCRNILTSSSTSTVSSLRDAVEALHSEIHQQILSFHQKKMMNSMSNTIHDNTIVSRASTWAQTWISRMSQHSAKMLPSVGISNYISLKGTLSGLFKMCQSMFGITITEDEKPRGWHRTVRLFHLRRNKNSNDDPLDSEILGSFYLDPFQRRQKRRGYYTRPLALDMVYISADIAHPSWDLTKAPVEMKDIEMIFHHFGHVLQYLLADVDKRTGLLVNSNNINNNYDDTTIMATATTTTTSSALLDCNCDTIVPRLMQHFVRQEHVLANLALLSSDALVTGQSPRLPSHVADHALEDCRQRKIMECHRNAIAGQMELELFSKRPTDGTESAESLINFQRRMYQHFMVQQHPETDDERQNSPLPIMDATDLSMLVQLVLDNNQYPAAQYRHLISEVISADIYQTFQETPITQTLDEEDDEETTRAFGRTIEHVLLKPGVMVDAKTVLKQLCGRDTLSTENLFRLYKLV